MTEHNLPDKDDAPWLNLTEEEIEELRKNKQELTEYGKKKIRELMNHEEILQIARDLIDQHGDAMKALAEIEKDELIDQAIEELGWIVSGGQDGEEFYNSINFIKRVLERCKQ